MGLQHQHHPGKLRQTGEFSEATKCSSIQHEQMWCNLVLFIFYFMQAEEGKIWGSFYSEMSDESQNYPIDQITDLQLKLQLISLQDKGSGALSPDTAEHVRLKCCVKFQF